MNRAYPLHPAVAAGLRAADAAAAELQGRMRENARRDNQAAKARTTFNGMQPPAPGSNPWLDQSWNLSQQSFLMNKDPQTAARLRSEAGLDGMFTPTRADAQRVQASGGFIASKVAAAVTPKIDEPAEPAPAPLALAKTVSTSASEEALDMARDVLRQIGATVSDRLFIQIAEALDNGARTNADGTVEMHNESGELLVDLRATGEEGRIVGYSPARYVRSVIGIEPDPPKATKPEEPAPSPDTKPMHVRVQEAYAQGPDAVASLMAELGQRA